MHTIYLDYMSTTPVDPRVLPAMTALLSAESDFGNAASLHSFGQKTREHIARAREQVAAFIHAEPASITWTSGATESINLALKGAAFFYQRQGKHIITMASEHKAGLETCRYLETQGFEVTYLLPNSNGLLDINELKTAIRPDTILASIMHVNNETGVIQEIARMGKLLREQGVLFHVDAAQSAGKIPIDVQNLSVDLLSLSAHKMHGPKGVGVLYVRRKPRVQLIPQMQGGAQDNAWRVGTLPTHQIVGMGVACEIAREHMTAEIKRITSLRDQFENRLRQLPGIKINGDLSHRIGHCSHFTVDDICTDAFLKELSDIAISQGSACNAVDAEPSHVLTAMGIPRAQANRSFRVSMGRFTTQEDIVIASNKITAAIQKERSQRGAP